MNIFCDALAQAYGAVAYFVFLNKDYKQNICSFVLPKSRLSPLKEQCSITVPKLELQAAVLAVRLKCTILEETDFDIDKVRFWTDRILGEIWTVISIISLKTPNYSTKKSPIISTLGTRYPC